MGSIRKPSNPGSGSTEDTAFIQCVDGKEPHIHELWCLSLDKITREVHPTAQVEDIYGTAGEFVTDYFAKNVPEYSSSGNFLSTTASNFLVLLTKAEEVDCRLFTTCRLPLRRQGGEVETILIRIGEGVCSTLT